MSIYTIKQVAIMENCKEHQVAYWCRSHDVKKIGTAYILSLEDIEKFRKRRGKGWLKGRQRK